MKNTVMICWHSTELYAFRIERFQERTLSYDLFQLFQANQVLVIPWIVLTIIGLIFGLANLIRSIHGLVLFIRLGNTFFRWSSCCSFDQEQTEENIPSHFQHTLRRSCSCLLLIGFLRVFFFVVVWSNRFQKSKNVNTVPQWKYLRTGTFQTDHSNPLVKW